MHCDVHLLPEAGGGALQERQQNPLRREQARHEIGDGEAKAKRCPIGITGHAHQAAFGLGHGVDPGEMGERPGLAVPGDGRVDQSRHPRRQGRVVKSESFERAGTKVFHEHVGPIDERVENAASLRQLEVEREALLVAIDA